jgi:hypothetical protein
VDLEKMGLLLWFRKAGENLEHHKKLIGDSWLYQNHKDQSLDNNNFRSAANNSSNNSKSKNKRNNKISNKLFLNSRVEIRDWCNKVPSNQKVSKVTNNNHNSQFNSNNNYTQKV